MALTPPSYSPNPYVAYVWVNIEGVDITIPQKGPRRLTNFTYARIGDVGGNRASIAFFDDDWTVIEEAIASTTNPQITFRYGYTDGLQSPTYKGDIYDYKPVLAIDGTKIVIEVISHGMYDEKDRVKSRVWKDLDIHEIVGQIAKEHGWTTDIEECESVWDNDDLDKTMVVKKHFKQSKMRDLQFIYHSLIPFSHRKKDKRGNYQLWIDDENAVLHFHPPRFEQDEDKSNHYVFMRDKMSEVISFSPEISGQVNLRFGGGVAAIPYMDMYTGVYEDLYHNNQTTPEKTLLGGKWTVEGKVTDENYSASIHAGVRDVSHADILVRDRFHSMMDSVFGAELVIQGHPRKKIHKLIRMTVLTDDGKLHYTSGLYEINDISDNIDGGQYTTTMNLIRNAHPPEAGGDVGVGNPRP